MSRNVIAIHDSSKRTIIGPVHWKALEGINQTDSGLLQAFGGHACEEGSQHALPAPLKLVSGLWFPEQA